MISGTEEARLIHRAAVYGVRRERGPAATIDIGGGSIEITLGNAEKLQLGRSFKMGVIRLTERFAHRTRSPRATSEKWCSHIHHEIEAARGPIVESGSIASSAHRAPSSASARSRPTRSSDAPGEIRNLRIPARQVHRLRKQVVSLGLQQRLKLPGLEPRRSDIVVAGAVLLDTILRRIGATEITLCDLALREGLVLDYINRNRQQIAQADRYPDVRRRSVIELAERCHYAPEHAQQIARLALSLFDQTRAVHGLDDREREWLEYAAPPRPRGAHQL